MPERDPYFALADPTRRAIIDALWEGGARPAGAIAAMFPAISRPAVSKHLAVLREAGLVTVTAHGREAWYALDTARLRELHEAWFARFAPLLDSSLEALKARVESTPPVESPPRTTLPPGA